MKIRRKLLALITLGALPVFPSVAQQGKVWRVGILSIRSRPVSLDSDFQYGPFLKGLRELGYTEGKNLAVEWRFAHGKYELLPALAAELVRLKVDVIVVINVPVIRAAQQATNTIPIVMLTSSDPVGAGFVASLARPGGNITGPSNINVDLSSKYLELLTVIIPKLSKVAFLLNPANSSHRVMLKNIQATAAKAGIKTLPVEAATSQQLEGAFATSAKERAGAVIVGLDTLFSELRQKIVDLTVRHRIPSMFADRLWVKAGGLMSYGEDFTDRYRHAATYVDKIFKGAKPADLPVELATKLQLVINRKTATALGLTISPELLLRADEVIE
jgi:putative tryptophan/tyrosine transport system substrate-binding protein